MIMLLIASLAPLLATTSNAQQIVDDWRYILNRPANNWQQPDFDDDGWKDGSGGFGDPGTPGSRVGTKWFTNNIWLRKTINMDDIPAKPALLIHHDEDVRIFINGTQVLSRQGFTTEFIIIPLEGDKRDALKKGKNLLAVHCKQTEGGQFIDVHIVDADNVPQLPAPKRDTSPFKSELITKWGEKVTPENVWTEYPRPQMKREQWQNLNGQWDYAVTEDKQTKAPQEWAGKILVPFSLESKLGGVQRLLDSSEALWYHRTFKLDKTDNQRTILNFEAVDYECEVFVNGQSVGKHKGGHTPFSFDITDAAKTGSNQLVVRVEDDTEAWQLRGKQVLNAHGIWYTQVSGIWQTVWLEQVPEKHFSHIKIDTSAKTGTVTVNPVISGTKDAQNIKVVIKDGDKAVAHAHGKFAAVTLKVPNAKRWSPDSPHLYNIEVTLLDNNDKPIDKIHSYTGIRDIGKIKDKNGHWRFTLNGEIIFHWGPLDQGWWPDGLLTPPSDEAMIWEIQWLKKAGFNMIRKHIKVEPRLYYYHCDRLGMMVWQDQVSGGQSPRWTRLQPNPNDANWPEEQHQQYMIELERMVNTLESHPSIVSWVPFNEAWGQHNTMAVGRWMIKRDPSRVINVASGGNFWPSGDIVDAHSYPHPSFPFNQDQNGRFKDYIKVVGEFGGHGYPVKGHLWDTNRRNWGYGGLPKTKEEYKERYVKSLQMLNDLRARGIAGGVYTQTTDVEGEINGLMTYDRKVIKIPAEELAELHKILFKPVSGSKNNASRN